MKPALILAIIGGLLALILALSNHWTAPQILEREAEAKLAAISRALPDPNETVRPLPPKGGTSEIYWSEQASEPTGYLFGIRTNAGYSGKIEAWLSVTLSGEIRRIYTFSHKETPGIGHIIEPDQPFIRQFEGINLLSDGIHLRSNGGTIDAVTGATITSRAIIDALTRSQATFIAARGATKELDG